MRIKIDQGLFTADWFGFCIIHHSHTLGGGLHTCTHIDTRTHTHSHLHSPPKPPSLPIQINDAACLHEAPLQPAAALREAFH